MAMKKGTLLDKWRKIRSSSQFRNVLLFMVFVAISVLFWLIISLNDSVTHTFSVSFKLENVPNSVTFINDPPVDMHVTLRDKGTKILRSGIAKNPTMHVNFQEYASNGILRMSRSDLNTALKQSFGNNVTISSISLDSLRLCYTTQPGKLVPVIVRVDVSASFGNIIAGPPVPLVKAVRVYSFGNETDTITHVYTQRLVKRNLEETSVFDVKVQPIGNVRIVPSVVKVQINVDPLVLKEGYATVATRGVPEGESLLLFPNRVPVKFYVPMSLFNDEDVPVEVIVDYADTRKTAGNKLPVYIADYPGYIVTPELKVDSVEYTLVRH